MTTTVRKLFLSVYDTALLCEAAYHHKSTFNQMSCGRFTVIDTHKYEQWKAFLVQDSTTSELIVVFRGTDNWRNWLDDFLRYLHLSHKRDRILDNMREQVESWQRLYNGKISLLTGPSAGGYIASRIRLVQKIIVVTFNSPKAKKGAHVFNIATDGDPVSKRFSKPERVTSVGPGGHKQKDVIKQCKDKEWEGLFPGRFSADNTASSPHNDSSSLCETHAFPNCQILSDESSSLQEHTESGMPNENESSTPFNVSEEEIDLSPSQERPPLGQASLPNSLMVGVIPTAFSYGISTAVSSFVSRTFESWRADGEQSTSMRERVTSSISDGIEEGLVAGMTKLCLNALEQTYHWGLPDSLIGGGIALYKLHKKMWGDLPAMRRDVNRPLLLHSRFPKPDFTQPKNPFLMKA